MLRSLTKKHSQLSKNTLVILSDTDSTFNFVAALMYSQLFNLLCDKADDFYGGRLPVHVRLILDEFANIGQIPNAPTAHRTCFFVSRTLRSRAAKNSGTSIQANPFASGRRLKHSSALQLTDVFIHSDAVLEQVSV